MKSVKDLYTRFKTLELIELVDKNDHEYYRLLGFRNLEEIKKKTSKYYNYLVMSIKDYYDTQTTSVIIKEVKENER